MPRKPKEVLNPKYADLIRLSRNRPGGARENILYLSEEYKAVIGTDGSMLIAQRALYDETRVLARVLTATDVLKYEPDGTLIPDKSDMPGFNAIVPDQATLNKAYLKVILTLPDWVAKINKTADETYISFVMGKDAPLVALGIVKDSAVSMNVRYLQDYAEKKVCFYIPIKKKEDTTGYGKPIVVMEVGKGIADTSWFSLIMPIRQDRPMECAYG